MLTPPTRLPPPPRTVRSKSGSGCAWAMATPFLLFGLGMVAVVAVRLWVRHAGEPVTAVVQGRSQYTSKGHTHHFVQLRYDLHGRPVRDSQEVTADEARRAMVGTTVRGRAVVLLGWPVCLADYPSVASQTTSRMVPAAVWNGLLLVPVLYGIFSPRRTRRLVATGTAVGGTVTAAYRAREPTSLLTVNYRFAGPGGPVDGKLLVGDSDRGGAEITVSQVVTVVYDPGRPTRNTVYEWSGYRVQP